MKQNVWQPSRCERCGERKKHKNRNPWCFGAGVRRGARLRVLLPGETFPYDGELGFGSKEAMQTEVQ